MTEVKQGAGFRYSKLMAWGPVVMLAFAMVLIAQDFMTLGLILAICGVLFGLIVRRRRREQERQRSV